MGILRISQPHQRNWLLHQRFNGFSHWLIWFWEPYYSNHAQCDQANNNAPLREKSTCKREADFDETGENASTNKEITALYDQKDKLEKRKKELEYKVGTYKDTFFCNGQTCYPTKTTCLSKAGGGSGPTPANICVPYYQPGQ